MSRNLNKIFILSKKEQGVITTIVFDLGGVILMHSPELGGHIISEIFNIPFKQGLALWNQYRHNLMRDDISLGQFLEKIKEKVPSGISAEEFEMKWKEKYLKNAKINVEVLDLVKGLAKKYKVYLLTDTTRLNDSCNKKRGIYENFAGVFKSFDEKITKADGSQIFVRMLEKIHAMPEQCIFIDDSPAHVQTADSLGVKGIVFVDAGQLKARLKTFIN